MRIEFIYTLQGMEVTLFSKRTDGDMVNLGKLIFADSAGERPDLLKAFRAQTHFCFHEVRTT
jgi:hypothetical protein